MSSHIVCTVSQAVAKARIQKRGVDRQTVHTQELRMARLHLVAELKISLESYLKAQIWLQ